MLTARSTRRIALVVTVAAGSLLACATVDRPLASCDVRPLEVPERIERGRYLVNGPAHCAACHGDPVLEEDRRRGREIPLSGGRTFRAGVLGTVVAPNITSDPVAGIGSLSDDTLIRSLRYGISRHGRPLIPYMSFASLSDADLQAILSYLRTLAPVVSPVPPNDLSWFSKIAIKLVLRPQDPRPAPSCTAPERTTEYGRYLAHAMANCHGCHTQRSKLTGAFIGPDFAGGMEIEHGGMTFVAPNVTRHASGALRWITEAQFIELFRIDGRGLAGSPMPWESYARMSDTDLAALYRYLMTVEPAEALKR
jgi:mono/diheme cytochrome c family protein